MSIESIILNTIQNLKPPCAVSNFAAICGMGSPARVSSALNGQRPFDSEDGPLYMNVARKMKALQDAAYPLPIDWSEVVTIKAILAAVSDGSLHISVHEEQPVAPPEQQYFVFMPDERFFFVSRRPDYYGRPKISGNFQSTGAPQMSKACADKIVEALAKIGHRAQVVVSRITGSGIGDFESLWAPDEVKTEQI